MVICSVHQLHRDQKVKLKEKIRRTPAELTIATLGSSEPEEAPEGDEASAEDNLSADGASGTSAEDSQGSAGHKSKRLRTSSSSDDERVEDGSTIAALNSASSVIDLEARALQLLASRR